jgi:spermidine dehydrogenase
MADKPDITRRDFLGGMALGLTAGTSLTPFEILAAAAPDYYPPALTGMRGNHPGSFEVAHAVAWEGKKYKAPAKQTDASYDLVVAGGGISGLAAAHLFRKLAGADARILVLDNHDDFGGHAKRNEFTVAGDWRIGYGGSQSIDTPSEYSRDARELLAELDIDPEHFYQYFDRGFAKRHGLSPGVYFGSGAYGRDLTAPNVLGGWYGTPGPAETEAAIAAYPLSAESKASLLRLLTSRADILEGVPAERREAMLRAMSYSDFLRKHAGVTEEVVTLLRDRVKGYWGVGWDALSALEACRLEEPGTAALGVNPTPESPSGEEPYIFHFPDGNASIARALVRALVPDAVPGATMEDLVRARVDYSMLDRESARIRVRLNSTAVSVRHGPDGAWVDVVYVRNGKPERVRARHVVLACYGQMIPYIVPELPPPQREAIRYAVKTPLVYINIAVRNWQAFADLGYHQFYVPKAELMDSFGLDFPVSMGGYEYAADPGQPTVLHGEYVPTTPDAGLDNKQQFLRGQRRLFEMSFDDFETAIRHQLDGALGRAGFDAGRDIAAITVNRWPHGYAYEYNDLYDPPAYDRQHGPHVAGRARIGRISIANSDSSAYAYANGAIDAAYRAVTEQLGDAP